MDCGLPRKAEAARSWSRARHRSDRYRQFHVADLSLDSDLVPLATDLTARIVDPRSVTGMFIATESPRSATTRRSSATRHTAYLSKGVAEPAFQCYRRADDAQKKGAHHSRHGVYGDFSATRVQPWLESLSATLATIDKSFGS